MAGSETHSSAREFGLIVTPLRFGVVLCVVSLGAWLNTSTPSFHPILAPLKLAIGLLHLVAIGAACSKLLRLERPRVLASAHDALLGQVACLAYVYARSTASNLLGFAGISPAETFLVEAILFSIAFSRSGPWQLPTWRTTAESTTIHLLWLGWLIAVTVQKLDLHYTPSSDPDIHAYYAKILLDRGRIFYDLLPNSDAWMVYPSGFSSLNFVLGRLSGLHPVQLVNVTAYLQLALFAGMSFSFLASSFAKTIALLPFATLHFGFAYLGFNAVFGEHRMFLEGTPRLAHTGLLFFPLLFAMQHRSSLARHRWLWSVPAIAVAVGACINPSHAPAACLVGTMALFAARGTNQDAAATQVRSLWRWIAHAAAALVLAAVFLSSDPFYRGLFVQRATAASERDQATDLTGAAFAPDLNLGALISKATPAALRGLTTAPGEVAGRDDLRAFLLAAIMFVLALRIASARTRKCARCFELTQLTRFAGAALVILLLHAVWSEFTSWVGRPGVLQTRLLVQYTYSLQAQISSMFFSMAPSILLAFAFGVLDRTSNRSAPRASALKLILALGLLGVSLPFFQSIVRVQDAKFYAELRNSPLGYAYASDIEFSRQVQERVAPDERILLPGRLRRMPGEHWIFTTHAGRAIPLFSNAKTSFFLGLDGLAFTAGAYDAHVEPPNFDPQWLREKKVIWLVESGNFPVSTLGAHYQRVFGNDHAVLWRLRD